MTKKHTRAQGGYILLTALVFAAMFTSVSVGLINAVTQSARVERANVAVAQAQTIAEAGIDKAVYELNQSGSYTGESGTSLGAGMFTTSVAAVNSSTKSITSTGYVPNAVKPTAKRTIKVNVGVNSSVVSFRYGVQVDRGGVSMGGGSRINGNLFSNGNVSGSGTITGDATVGGGATTSLSGITVQGNAYAHALSGCSVGKDAYYQTISGCSVGGVSHPGSPDQPPSSLPISDAQIADWQNAAAAGGSIGSQTISGTVSLGPKKIAGNLTVSDNATLTVTGTLWVTGILDASNNATIKLSSSYGTNSGVIVTDSVADVSNNVTFSGSGQSGSYLMLVVSKNDPAHEVLEISNNVVGAIFAAPHGRVHFNNNAGAKEVTGYGFDLGNNATITYESGLQNETFSNGPGGSWAVVRGTYSILP